METAKAKIPGNLSGKTVWKKVCELFSFYFVAKKIFASSHYDITLLYCWFVDIGLLIEK